jgi:hypothetical protein
MQCALKESLSFRSKKSAKKASCETPQPTRIIST